MIKIAEQRLIKWRIRDDRNVDDFHKVKLKTMNQKMLPQNITSASPRPEFDILVAPTSAPQTTIPNGLKMVRKLPNITHITPEVTHACGVTVAAFDEGRRDFAPIAISRIDEIAITVPSWPVIAKNSSIVALPSINVRSPKSAPQENWTPLLTAPVM